MSKRLLSNGGLLPALRKVGIATLMMLFMLPMAHAQQSKELRGVVLDAQGAPVAYATVVVPGTSVGTATDSKGNFKLNLPETESTIQVSFVGYDPLELPVKGGTTITVTLEESSILMDEAVVVGYGVQSRTTITGSVASMKGAEVMQSPQANLTNSLAGRMPGVFAFSRSGQPGEDFSEILIRGKATTGNSQPLFVIDGVAERWGNIDRLNPSDIESITVLKDASAAIYGSRSANGVILVTTKRGAQGSKPVITYDGSVSLSQNTRVPKLMNAYEYMNYQDEVSFYTNETPMYTAIKDDYLDGTINTRRYADTDWMKTIFKGVAPKTEHSVSVRGGNDQVRYYVSGGMLYQKPVYKDTDFNYRTNQLRSNIDAKITRDFTLSLDMTYRTEKRHDSNYNTATVFWEGYQAHPFLYDYYPWDDHLPGPGISNGLNPALMTSGKTGYYKEQNNYFNSKIGFDLQMPWVTEGLSFNGHFAFDSHFRHRKTLVDQWDAYEYDDINDTYRNVRESTGVEGDNYLWERDDRRTMNSLLLKLNYDRQFGDHKIGAFVAYEQSSKSNEYLEGSVKDLYTTGTDYLFAGEKDKKVSSAPYDMYARQHYFGRINYSYKDRYLFEFTARNDGSSNFPKGKRRGWFPGASIGWRISEEAFMQNVDFIQNLKLRGSVGLRGNDDVPAYQYLNTFGMVTNSGGIFGQTPVRYLGTRPGRVPNSGITWEKDLTYNIGVETTMFKGQLVFSADYFYSKRRDILARRNAEIPVYTGMNWDNLPHENIGKVDNYGVEFEIMHRKDINNDFSYYVGTNFTFARNKVVYMAEPEDTPEWRRWKGKPIDSHVLYKTNGIDKTTGNQNIIDVSGDGTISEDDMIRANYGFTPEIMYGILMGAKWKQFSLDILFQGQGRGKTFIKPQGTRNFSDEFYKHRWTPENPDAKYPRAFGRYDPINMKNSEVWLKSTNFLRLKNVELSYTFNQRQLDKIGLQGLRLYVSGNNLFVIDKIKIFDPEVSDYERKGEVASGMGFPLQRMYNFGVNISF